MGTHWQYVMQLKILKEHEDMYDMKMTGDVTNVWKYISLVCSLTSI